MSGLSSTATRRRRGSPPAVGPFGLRPRRLSLRFGLSFAQLSPVENDADSKAYYGRGYSGNHVPGDEKHNRAEHEYPRNGRPDNF